MCGIAGYFGTELLPEVRIERCLSTMRRRGPDHAAWVHHETPAKRQAYLLSARLSIIDLDARSNQPMRVGRKWLTYNGELYNYREVRAGLCARGRSFRTASDAEVLLAAIDAEGWTALDGFEGMWAFAVYDEADGSLTLSRDRFGEKPLYLARAADGIYFGSEPKFIGALSGRRFEPDLSQVRRFLVNGYKALNKQPSTFFKDLEELPAATTLRIESDGRESRARYWHLAFQPDETLGYDDAVAGVRERLIRSVELRLRADVPLAFCMSGGVDSNAIIAIAKKACGYDVHGFTLVSSDERYDERATAIAAARQLGVRHTVVPVERDGFLDRLRELVRYHDAPVYTLSYFGHWRLMHAVSAAGYKVAVSGTAADELLTGYYDHHLAYLAVVSSNPTWHEASVRAWERRVRPFVRNPHLSDPNLFVNAPAFRDHIYLDAAAFAARLHEPFAEPFAETSFTSDLLRNRMLNELAHEAVPIILHEDDLNAMYWSVENRSPYLDRSLVELCYRIPTRHLIRDGFGKAILRDAVRDLVPPHVLDEPRKIGFNLSVTELLDAGDPDVRAAVLDDSPIWRIVRRDAIAPLLDRTDLTNSESKFLFSVLGCKMFLEELG